MGSIFEWEEGKGEEAEEGEGSSAPGGHRLHEGTFKSLLIQNTVSGCCDESSRFLSAAVDPN